MGFAENQTTVTLMRKIPIARPDSRQVKVRNGEQQPVAKAIYETLSEQKVDEWRAVTGYNKRKRLCTAWRLLITVIIAFLSGDTLGFASLRAVFVSRFGPIESSAFQNRLKQEAAAKFFQLALSEFVRAVVSKAGLSLAGALGCYDDVRVYDATCERLPPRGRGTMPACAKDKAGAKMLVGYSLKTGLAEEAVCEAQTSAELPMWHALVPTFARNVLYLFDLGYFEKAIFTGALNAGADVLMRLKSKTRITVTGLATPTGITPLPRWSHLTFLRSVSRKRGSLYDLDVVWGKATDGIQLRLVGYAHRYNKVRWYLTTASREKLTAQEVVEAYRLRWLIELLFREIKQSTDLGRSFTANEHAVRALSYGAMLAHAIVRSIRIATALSNDVPLHELRPLACLRMIRACAHTLAEALERQIPSGWRRLFETLSGHFVYFAREKQPSRSRPRIALNLGACGA